ncbi:DNA helicase UvrD [Candidatus Roizmanbacteria bacterium]|nr:DNA helicase UvrD [Candidatus Roizmanbacteria bacterium]
MQVIADLQIHSKYSRAVSPKMNLTEISQWAAKKGINLVATGDWTHPLWFKEIKENLKEVNLGIFSLVGTGQDLSVHNTKFLLSTEISSIYSQGDKVRRVHNLIFSPSIGICEKIINELKRRGANLMADGRPIVGLSSKDLLQMVLEIDEKILFIPAHIWTPWFSVFGSKSGFDSLEECFGELADNIYAVETGLSSDPIMNWQIKELESRSIVSFSDAHSGPKLGREATVFMEKNPNDKTQNPNFTYDDIAGAIRQDGKSKFKIGYTIEFFPEEGKYHWTGHRSCNIRYNALETKKNGVICSVCGKPLTVGVENRVLDLSSKTFSQEDLIFMPNKVGLTFVYDKEKKRRPFVSMVPLLEILLETNNGSPVKAQNEYEMLMSWATEFEILLEKPYQEIEKQGGETLMTAIKTVRERKVFVDPGYDGVFGKVKIFKETPKKNSASQQSLF